MEPSIHLERELVEPVDLCQPNGHLNPDAVGWSRRPIQRCNLKGRWLAKKRWNYWALTTETNLFSATISNVDYIGMVFIYFADFKSGEMIEKTIITPFGAGCNMPETVRESLSFLQKGISVEMEQTAKGVRIAVETPDFDSKPLSAEFFVTYPQAHETLNVVIPWNERTFQFTAKHNTLPVVGSVRLADREIRFEGPQSFACLDYGRGIWPRRSTWNWGAASGRRNGRLIGLNLGGKWTDGTGMTENALCVDGRITKVSEDLIWEYDNTNFMHPWRIRAQQTGMVDLVFNPFIERVASSKIGPLQSEVHQMFGCYEGAIITGEGERIEVHELVGWAEDHKAQW